MASDEHSSVPGSVSNLHWHPHRLTQQERAEQKSQQPCLIWFTGLSASGKSTLADALEQELYRRGHHSFLLDGDNVRHGLNRDLGFSDQDRVENIRRIGETAKLFTEAGLIVLCAFISPFSAERRWVRELMPAGAFVEVHLDTPLAVCEQRDPNALYKKARAGQINNFTGIDSIYQCPENPELRIDTSRYTVEASVQLLTQWLADNGLIKSVVG